MIKSTFSVARDFSPFAGPRKTSQGAHSGEALRSKLVKFLDAHPGRIVVVLDGTKGMGSSFLDEAFGGLIRYEGRAKSDLERRLEFQSRIDPSYINTIRDSFERAAREAS